jgi:hypothetical protein
MSSKRAPASNDEASQALNMLKWQLERCKIYFYAESLRVPDAELDAWINEFTGLGRKPYAHQAQRDLHLAVADIKILRGGNRSGKSVFLVDEIAMECDGVHPLQDDDFCRKVLGLEKAVRPRPPVYWWVVAPIIPSDSDIPTGEDAPILRKFFDWVPCYNPDDLEDMRYASLFMEAGANGVPQIVPKERRRGIKKFYRKDKLLAFHNGSVVKFKGHDQDMTRMASDDVDGIGHDEESPYRFWNEFRARTVDRKGVHLFAMTPTYASWTWQEFQRPEHQATRIKEVEMDMMLNPFLDDEAKRKFADGLSGQELLMRRHGKYVHAEGLAFKNFDRNRHVLARKDWPEINDRDFTIYVIIDWHAAKAIPITYLAIDPTGTWYVWEESEVTEHEPLSLAQEVESRVAKRRVRKYIIDRNASIKQVQEGKKKPKTIVDMLRALGIRCETGSVEPFESAHAFLEEKLKHDELFIFDRCSRHVHEFATWGVDRRKTGELRGTFRDKFADEGNDTCINLCYAYNAGARYSLRRAGDWPLTSYEQRAVSQ